ncbi:hypothetical protein HMPREF0742_01682 [Rothia aeria F0184]|uniref:Uncharacterized protein n=1 Tax=Rothia aeria F0184 TaxID=888019 RepID=U7V4M5_9MICC|nr:hypothetical protein HMPREF0742_01682 [Rothia aeria F0184]
MRSKRAHENAAKCAGAAIKIIPTKPKPQSVPNITMTTRGAASPRMSNPRGK